MPQPIIRPARPEEHDAVARVWMESWVSTGLEDASNFLLTKLRARIPMEIEKGWSLFVANDGGTLAAMLALHLRDHYLDQLFLRRNIRARISGGNCWHSRERICRTVWLRCVRENQKAWRCSARGFCIREGTGRANHGVYDEVLPMEEIMR
jgi:hypothetical protein